MFIDKRDAFSTYNVFTKFTIILTIASTVTLSTAVINKAQADTVTNFPILEKLQALQKPLTKETTKWMTNWRGVDLDSPDFILDELSGSTSIYMKAKKVDPSKADGFKAYGSYMSNNESGNPYSEIAYFNLAAILGYDHIFRPAVRYSLGSRAKQAFQFLIETTDITGENRLRNKDRILQDLSVDEPLKGAIKAKKLDSNIAYDEIIDISDPDNSIPQINNPIIMALQAENVQPVSGQKLQLLEGYEGDVLQLAREYSIIMTLDVVFQQWDRYSGENVVLAKDDLGAAHFYSTDNGGAHLKQNADEVVRNIQWFSRYDRNTIAQLRTLYRFLAQPSRGFLGYTDAKKFVVDLGLYDGRDAEYVALLKRNLKLLLDRVAQVSRDFGRDAYLP